MSSDEFTIAILSGLVEFLRSHGYHSDLSADQTAVLVCEPNDRTYIAIVRLRRDYCGDFEVRAFIPKAAQLTARGSIVVDLSHPQSLDNVLAFLAETIDHWHRHDHN